METGYNFNAEYAHEMLKRKFVVTYSCKIFSFFCNFNIITTITTSTHCAQYEHSSLVEYTRNKEILVTLYNAIFCACAM